MTLSKRNIVGKSTIEIWKPWLAFLYLIEDEILQKFLFFIKKSIKLWSPENVWHLRNFLRTQKSIWILLPFFNNVERVKQIYVVQMERKGFEILVIKYYYTHQFLFEPTFWVWIVSANNRDWRWCKVFSSSKGLRSTRRTVCWKCRPFATNWKKIIFFCT